MNSLKRNYKLLIYWRTPILLSLERIKKKKMFMRIAIKREITNQVKEKEENV